MQRVDSDIDMGTKKEDAADFVVVSLNIAAPYSPHEIPRVRQLRFQWQAYYLQLEPQLEVNL